MGQWLPSISIFCTLGRRGGGTKFLSCTLSGLLGNISMVTVKAVTREHRSSFLQVEIEDEKQHQKLS